MGLRRCGLQITFIRTVSANNSGRGSPVWPRAPPPKSAPAFLSLYEEGAGAEHQDTPSSPLKFCLRILTFGLSGDPEGPVIHIILQNYASNVNTRAAWRC